MLPVEDRGAAELPAGLRCVRPKPGMPAPLVPVLWDRLRRPDFELRTTAKGLRVVPDGEAIEPAR